MHFARLRASTFAAPSTTRHSKEARKSWLRAERLQGKILSPQLMTGSKDARSHFLHDRFRFVDQTKRALSGIGDTVIARVPQLRQSATCELQHAIADIYYLWFRTGDRSCQISYHRNNEFTDAAFHWDECELFSFRADDNEQLADVLKRWLCDREMPSTMRTEFPWLSIGDL